MPLEVVAPLTVTFTVVDTLDLVTVNGMVDPETGAVAHNGIGVAQPNGNVTVASLSFSGPESGCGEPLSVSSGTTKVSADGVERLVIAGTGNGTPFCPTIVTFQVPVGNCGMLAVHGPDPETAIPDMVVLSGTRFEVPATGVRVTVAPVRLAPLTGEVKLSVVLRVLGVVAVMVWAGTGVG